MEDYRDRNRLWQSNSLESRIANARIVIGGIGGLGWQIGGSLVGLGARNLTLFDPDSLEIVNLNRLWGCSQHQIGKTKVQIFQETAHCVDDGVAIKTHVEAVPCLNFEKALENADVVFGGFDKPEPRLATQILALKSNTLYIDAGVSILTNDNQFTGRGQVFFSKHRESGCLVCAGLRLDNMGYRGEGEGPLPSSGVLNGILANLAISTWLHHLQDKDVAPITYFDWGNLALHTIPTLKKRHNCPICGPFPAWEKL